MREIQPNELRPALDQFSKAHQGWMTALQDSDEVVKQTEARDLPLLDVQPGPVRDHLEALLHALNEQDPANFPYRKNQVLSMEPAGSGVSGMQKNYGQALAALGALVALVLLIACVNVANLLLAQTAARSREIAVRVSIGAGRTRLMQLVLAESAMLAFLSAAAGTIVAWLATPFMVARINPPDNPARLSLTADWRVLVFGLAVTLAVTVLLGVPPAFRASAVQPASVLRGGEQPRSRRRLMHVLIAVQAAFCLLVLFISGLFFATFDRLAHQRTGFSVNGLLALDMVTPRDEMPFAWNQVVEQLRSVPAVESAALCEWPLLDGSSYRLNHVAIPGAPPSQAAVRFLIVSPGWIGTMKIPLVEGRDLRANETGAAIVNREFARKFLVGQEPVGKWFTAEPGGAWGHRFQIVGLAGDTRYRTVRDPIVPIAYIPFQLPSHKETIMVRVSGFDKTATGLRGRSLAVAAQLRAGPEFRVTNIRTEEGMLQAQMVREQLLARLALFFGAVALLLAGIGLYGVLDYSVLQRRRENRHSPGDRSRSRRRYPARYVRYRWLAFRRIICGPDSRGWLGPLYRISAISSEGDRLERSRTSGGRSHQRRGYGSFAARDAGCLHRPGAGVAIGIEAHRDE